MTLDTEKTMLGYWLKGECLEDLEQVEEKDFAYEKVIKLLKEGKTAVEIHELTNTPMVELMKMTQGVTDFFYKQALDSYHIDKIRQMLHEVKDASIDDIKKRIEVIDRGFNKVEADKGLAEEYLHELNQRKNAERIQYSRLPTLNNMTGGIRKKELTTIAARPSVGKSAFALQIALGVQAKKKKVLYFPLEMSRTETIDRILCHTGYATSTDLRNGKLEDVRLSAALDYIYNMEKNNCFKLYEGVSNIELIEKAIATEKPFLVVIDQLTQLRSKKHFSSVRERFSYMTATLKAIAMRENVAIILLAQINRTADNIPPTMANLKESGSIEEDSDNIILLHKLKPEDMENPEIFDWNNKKPMTLNLAKQRNGATGEMNMVFQPKLFNFYEVAATTQNP